jgi:hypothetical protein
MNLLNFWRKPQEKDLTKQIDGRKTVESDYRGGASSSDILKGIYHGSNQEFSLASGFTYPAISVPVNLVGIPLLPKEHENLLNLLTDEGNAITRTMLINGTAWRWTRWSDKLKKLVWEIIPDAAIGNDGIELDVDTGEIIAISTNETLTFNRADSQIKFATRKRTITKETITEAYTGDIEKSIVYQNPFGFMPIPFAHDCWEGEWRGNSIYSRIIRLLKDNHDIRRNRDELLSQYKPKMIQTTTDANEWIKNNRNIGSNSEGTPRFNPFSADFILNAGSEATSFLFLSSDATNQHTQAIADNEKAIMLASGIPEIFWGMIATGNAASTDSQIIAGVNFIKEIQRELTKAYSQLLNQSAYILAWVKFGQTETFEVNWNSLDMTSAAVKANIMATYSGAISSMLSNGSISQEGAVYFTKLLYPDFPIDDAASYINGLNEMLEQHSSKIGGQSLQMGDIGF